MKLLTKSKFMAGLQCTRYLWTSVYEEDNIPALDKGTQFRLGQGTKVGELSKNMFPDGISVSTEDFKDNLTKSQKLLREKKPLFEGAFQFENIYSRADILEPVDGQWDIIEVKGSTKVKDEHLHDVAFQKFCYESYGLKVRNCYLLHLNKDYVRDGDLDIETLFIKEDITSEVDELIGNIKERIDILTTVMNSDEFPEDSVEHQCKRPKDCPLTLYWEFLPEYHVFHLYRGGKKSIQLYEDGIHAIADIPEEFGLNKIQSIQKHCAVSGNVYVDKDEIESFISTFEYPLYFLDFETFSTAIPMFDGSKPYSQIPFQFSLHVIQKEGNEPKHFEYLYEGDSDPRKEFISELKKVLGEKGSIVVYNRTFEVSRLKELAKYLPEYETWIESIINRIVDLWVPFRKFYYYNSAQKGSAKLKDVLPVITDRSYEGMNIADGNAASAEFYRITYNEVDDKIKKQVRENLLEYCKLDTLAEVMILEKLRELST